MSRDIREAAGAIMNAEVGREIPLYYVELCRGCNDLAEKLRILLTGEYQGVQLFKHGWKMSKKRMGLLRRHYPYEFMRYQYMFWGWWVIAIIIWLYYVIGFGSKAGIGRNVCLPVPARQGVLRLRLRVWGQTGWPDLRSQGTTPIKQIISKSNVKKSKMECLREEAKLLSSINHPNIVKVY